MPALRERVASSGPTQSTDILVLAIQMSDHRDRTYRKAKKAWSVPQLIQGPCPQHTEDHRGGSHI